MTHTRGRRLLMCAVLAAIVLAVSAAALLHLRSSVRRSLAERVEDGRPLQWVATMAPSVKFERWGDGTVEGVAATATGLLTAGGSGVRTGKDDLSAGLPTLRAAALALWRGRPVVALAGGGLFRRSAGGWEEVRSGWGTLHVRCLHETEGGELLVGAREGLFRAAWGGPRLERLDAHPVRDLAVAPGAVLAGGEEGLFRVESGRATPIDTADPWIESVGLAGGQVFAATAAGLVSGAPGQALTPVRGGEDVAQGVADAESFWTATTPPAALVRRVDAEGRVHEERLPAAVRRLMRAEGRLYADTADGLFVREAAGWRRALSRPPALPAGSSHLAALAFLGPRLVAGFFDGGLAIAEGGAPPWRAVPGSAAWGVNALLPAGGALFVASLRGAARFDGARLVPLPGPGAAFSLAATRGGVAIGYGQGVLVPGAGLLSAFHGLPGNQALALAAGDGLVVGTPSGLGALDGAHVRWRATTGDGRLPHPWVQALLVADDGLYVGTYGGGLVRRRAVGDGGRYELFVETEGLKISAGCLVEAGGRIFAGAEGRGLVRLSPDRARFEPLALPLPSSTVTALAAHDGDLWVGTDEGLARIPLAAISGS